MKILNPLCLSLLLSTAGAFAQGHGHINAGAKDTNATLLIDAGDKLFLYFEPGTQTTNLAANGGSNTYGADGYLWDGFTTFTSLHQSSFPSEAPNYNSVGALSGSFLRLQLSGMTGTMGARFAFYDAGAADPSWVYQVGTGFLFGDGTIALTEQAWFEADPSDPYGHIHGRRFGVNMPGTFTATWVLQDLHGATTGLLDSDAITTTYTAIPEPGTWGLLALGAAALLVRRRRLSLAR
jgi:hypothetical protein